jgi:hypothetical protein
MIDPHSMPTHPEDFPIVTSTSIWGTITMFPYQEREGLRYYQSLGRIKRNVTEEVGVFIVPKGKGKGNLNFGNKIITNAK